MKHFMKFIFHILRMLVAIALLLWLIISGVEQQEMVAVIVGSITLGIIIAHSSYKLKNNTLTNQRIESKKTNCRRK